MSILSTIESLTGIHFKKVASTAGGEYKGPCPFCNAGVDRFAIVPSKDRYYCRFCKNSGDTLQFYMTYQNFSYTQACIAAGKTPSFTKTPLSGKWANRDKWEPRENTEPSEIWQKKAEGVAFEAFKCLMSPSCRRHRAYLQARGISLDTAKKARLGLIEKPLTFDRAEWGFSTPGKDIWIPPGIIIPYFPKTTGKLVRLRIRQNDSSGGNRYILVAGSSTDFFICPGEQTENTLIVEAELDGWACWQAFGDLATIAAIGNSTTRPDLQTHNIIKDSRLLLSLDNDPAGRAEIEWWKKQYSNTTSFPVPAGKDPGDAVKDHNIDLRSWFLEKSKQEKPKRQSKYVSVPKSETPMPTSEVISEMAGSKPGASREQAGTKPGAKKTDQKICLHNEFCTFKKDGMCLLLDEYISYIKKCPKEKWWIVKTSENIEQIILGIGVRKI